MNILSLFDGMSCGQQALQKASIKVSNYYASEIDKYAISVTRYNYPNTKFIGSVTNIDTDNLPHIDMLIGGSPCQGFSFAGKQKGASTKCNIEITTLSQYLELKEKEFEFQGQSYLFWEYIRILRALQKKNPNLLFLLENVKMIKKWQSVFNEAVEVEPIEINSALVSAQNRKRLYWTNINNGVIHQPKDKGILLKDITEKNPADKYDLSEKRFNYMCRLRNGKAATIVAVQYKGTPYEVVEKPCELREFNKNSLCHHIANATDLNGNDSIKRVYADSGKAPTLTTMMGGHRQPKLLINESATKQGKSYCLTARYSGAVAWNSCQKNKKTMIPTAKSEEKNPNVYNKVKYRKLTPLECERLQTVKDNYTAKGLDENLKEVKISNTQRYKMIGNGWTVDVISHIFNHIFQPEKKAKNEISNK